MKLTNVELQAIAAHLSPGSDVNCEAATYSNVVAALTELIALRDLRRWRKFPEERPEVVPGRSYNVKVDGGAVQTSWYDPDDGDTWHGWDYQITHWLPLPPAPEEEA
jgi:hypothetical protein